MFPGAGAQIYRNEAGEPIGWDSPGDDPYDPDDYFAGDDDDFDDDAETAESDRLTWGEGDEDE